jgi:hypothetical protein
MSTHRAGTTCRLLVLLALTVVAVLGAGSTAANATFSDAATMSATTVGTGTVGPVTKVRIDTSCITTTTVIKRTYRTTATGTYQIGYAETSSTATSTSNIEGDDTVTTPSSTNPAEYTSTRTIKDTELYATARWDLSTSARVTRYRMTAHTTFGPVLIGEPGSIATSMTRQYDAEVLQYRPQLSIDTLTDYGWIGTSKLTAPVTC